jgi:hypothetical protein
MAKMYCRAARIPSSSVSAQLSAERQALGPLVAVINKYSINFAFMSFVCCFYLALTIALLSIEDLH